MKNSFKNVSANENNYKWENMIHREKPLYSRNNDFRSEFGRDYTRIIHSNAYRRLKHKTQVFFSPKNDHICTRIEHVNHVESISFTIANYLGLNTELTKAISVAHDLGHSPFGHAGEKILSTISQKDLGIPFWHEKNGLEFVDFIELLEDDTRNFQNLDLTYAVRDGIISHCGEIDENSLKPREEFINLKDYLYPNQFSPYTWEGCVVKISDKISYIGRDIEDAISLGLLDENLEILNRILDSSNTEQKINNTIIINFLITDLCKNSSIENGLCFSSEAFELLNKIKKFNYNYIYKSSRLIPSIKYFEIVLTEIYNLLKNAYDGIDTINNLEKMKKFYPNLINDFLAFVYKYFNLGNRKNLRNNIIFNINSDIDYYKCIIYFISGMTDNFAIDIYNEIISF